MSATFTIFVASTSGLMLLVLLLRIEDKRGSRLLLGGLRSLFDRGLWHVSTVVANILERLGGGMVRQILHFIIHRFLRLLLSVVRGLEFILRKLQRTNRQVAENIVAADADVHLKEMKHHADSIKLTPEEKRQKRREMLE